MADGHIVYQGEAMKSASYFTSISSDQFKFNCPKFANPADFSMRILSVNYPMSDDDTKKVEYLKEKYD